MAIFNSYVKLPEGIWHLRGKSMVGIWFKGAQKKLYWADAGLPNASAVSLRLVFSNVSTTLEKKNIP